MPQVADFYAAPVAGFYSAVDSFAGAWTVCEQNRLLSVCFGLPAANKA